MLNSIKNPFQDIDSDHDIESLVAYFDIPKAAQNSWNIEPAWHSLPYSRCKKEEILPLKIQDGICLIATSNPFQLQVEQELSFIFDVPVQFYYCPQLELLDWIDHYFHHEKGAASKLIQNLESKTSQDADTEIYDLLNSEQESAPSIRLLNFIIQEAVTQDASDIHFEPLEDTLRIRYRIDGVLQNRHTIPSHYKSHIMSRLKVMAQLDIAEMRRPQDGRIKLKSGTREIDFRVSTIPISNNERMVLRILDKNNLLLGFDKLGMNHLIRQAFEKMIHRSEGIILVTGPTGSGKTTTLYSAISEIYDDSLNIMTIEDPVEYKIPKIAQMSVRPKINLTFAAGLRHILRQDPDVILIGEIRDLETAQIAIQAALTGHLVFSTLHTNDAPSAVTRLVDMGIEPYLISSCVVGILAQRLLRTLCPHCIEEYTPTKKDLESLNLTVPQGTLLYRGKGCPKCYQTGYIGRQGIYELMPVSGKVKQHISKSADSTLLKKYAASEGLVSLKEQGCKLILEGKTTVEEVLRVAQGMGEDL